MSNRRVLVAGFMAPAAWLLAGCASGDLMSTVALPPLQTPGYAEGVDLPNSLDSARQSGEPELTPTQRQYLDGLEAAGIHPSNELRALNIGSYVCQARAAGQSEEAVWDSVAPMVRSDIATVSAATPQKPATAGTDAVVSNYIRIATQRLC